MHQFSSTSVLPSGSNCDLSLKTSATFDAIRDGIDLWVYVSPFIRLVALLIFFTFRPAYVSYFKRRLSMVKATLRHPTTHILTLPQTRLLARYSYDLDAEATTLSNFLQQFMEPGEDAGDWSEKDRDRAADFELNVTPAVQKFRLKLAKRVLTFLNEESPHLRAELRQPSPSLVD